MDLYEELLGLIDSLGKAGLDYALCGGIAVAFYGYSRFTKDIDILIRSEDLDQILKTIKDRGFSIKGGLMPFDWGKPNQREIYRISKVEGQELLTLDLILVNKNLQDVWDEREAFEWKNRQVQVVSPEGLIKMKRLAGRDQDLLDLKKLGFIDDEESGD
jgi:hypothetical protein